MKNIYLAIAMVLSTMTVSAQNAPKGPFEQGLKEPVVYRSNDVVFRRIDKHTWYGTGHLMANESVYLLEGKKKAMLIDCGTVMHDLDKIVRQLTRKPVELYLTHSHPDHSGMAVDYFKEIYLNPADTVGMAEFAPQYKGRLVFLKDRQVIDLGGRKIEVLFTPGHTPGSVTYIDMSHHYGFSGDSFGNGNLLLTGTFPTLEHSAQKVSDFMQAHKITKLWNGHYFGGNAETPERVADEITISKDVLSGRLTPQGKMMRNYDMLGLYHCIDTLGLKINYGKGALYTPEERAAGIRQAYELLKGCRNVYIASVAGKDPVITNDNAFNAYETDLYLMASRDSKLAQDVAENQNVFITAEKDGQVLDISCKLVEDVRATSKEALLRTRPDLQGQYDAGSKNTVIYKIKEVTARLNGEELKF